jgi:hypothetical protein
VVTPDERLSLLLHYNDHVVAVCCGESVKYDERATDLVPNLRQNLCPRCRSDLSDGVREHLRTCAQGAGVRSFERKPPISARMMRTSWRSRAARLSTGPTVLCREAGAGQEERRQARENGK